MSRMAQVSTHDKAGPVRANSFKRSVGSASGLPGVTPEPVRDAIGHLSSEFLWLGWVYECRDDLILPKWRLPISRGGCRDCAGPGGQFGRYNG